METSVTLSNLERQDRIVQFIEKNQRVTIDQLRVQFSISPATARRDLEILAEQGKIQRFHGGAMPNQSAPPDLPTLQRA
ncbi:MAG: DeoR family transcriptional regulator, partial [Anaerolineae bacterium]|nr:DeoR family transcriptional regulator [Anaerolineae bacterium]